MPNFSQIISRNNKKKMRDFANENLQAPRLCDCRDEPCPVEGQCLTPDVIYQATVTRQDNGHIEKYVGLSGGPFKLRYRVHKGNIRNRDEKGTKLSKYVWDLKRQDVSYELKWKFIAKAPSYTPSSGHCHLCIKEIFYIIYKKEESTLNSRNEVFNTCPHKRKYKLCKN